MRELRAPRLSADGKRVLLRDDLDQEYAVPADDLRAAVTPARREASMDSALRPKDIQARIRCGESAESVAQAAQVPVERIMVYVLPVLAERDHVAQRARAAAVRRRHAGVPSRLLGDAVAHQLRAAGADPDAATWDAWRREDGRWTVTVEPGDPHPAGTYLFDLEGRYAVADDDAGRTLIGDVPPTSAQDADEMAIATAVSVAGSGAVEPAADETDGRALEPAPAVTYVDEPVQAADADQGSGGGGGERSGDDTAGGDGDPGDQLTLDDLTGGATDAPAPRRRRERKRASVPSWDEIMFGGKSEP